MTSVTSFGASGDLALLRRKTRALVHSTRLSHTHILPSPPRTAPTPPPGIKELELPAQSPKHQDNSVCGIIKSVHHQETSENALPP